MYLFMGKLILTIQYMYFSKFFHKQLIATNHMQRMIYELAKVVMIFKFYQKIPESETM